MKRTICAALLLTAAQVAFAADPAPAPAAPAAGSPTAQPVDPKADYEKVSTNARSMYEALKAGAAEKGKSAQYAEVLAKIEGKMKDADAAAPKDLKRARSLMSEAFVTGRVALQGLQNGGASVAKPAEQREAQRVAKLRGDFDNRMSSTKALADALKRISTEKGKTKETAGHQAEVEKLMKQAADMSATDLVKARTVLDDAYVKAKVSIEALRRGDVLVRQLKFETKEDEYHYEVDRHETHTMLVQVLLEEKKDDTLARGFVEKAKVLRAEAEAKAAKKDYEGAVKTMEDATKELQRAIRNAGIYIPG